VRFQVHTAVLLKIKVLWEVMLRNQVDVSVDQNAFISRVRQTQQT